MIKVLLAGYLIVSTMFVGYVAWESWPKSCDQWTDEDDFACLQLCKQIELRPECFRGVCLCCQDDSCWELIYEPGC